MKKNLFFLIACLLFLHINGQKLIYPEGLKMPNPADYKTLLITQPFHNVVDTNFFSVFKKTLELNKNRFINLDLIQVGDSILFPPINSNKFEILIAGKAINNRHDCIWRLTTKYLERQSVFYNKQKTIIKNTEINNNNELNTINHFIKILFFIFLALLILVFVICFIMGYKKNNLDNTNTDYNNPLTVNLDLISHKQNFEHFKQFINKDEKLVTLEKGWLERSFGCKKLKVILILKNAKNKRFFLKDSTCITRVIVKNKYNVQHSLYFYNLTGQLFERESEITIPANWNFIPYMSNSKVAFV